MFKLFFIVNICVALSACAVSGQGLTVPNGKAIFIAENDSSMNILVPISKTATTRFIYIDGVKVSTFWKETNVVEIDPGKHSVSISCEIIGPNFTATGESQLSIDAMEGEKYSFKAKLISLTQCVVVRV